MNPEEPTLYGPDGVQRTPSLAPFEAEQGQDGGRHTSRSESQDFLTPFRRFLEAPVLLDNGRLMAQRTGEFWTCYYQNAIIARCETRPAASRFLEQFPEQMERWEEEQRVRISRARAYLWRKK